MFYVFERTRAGLVLGKDAVQVRWQHRGRGGERRQSGSRSKKSAARYEMACGLVIWLSYAGASVHNVLSLDCG